MALIIHRSDHPESLAAEFATLLGREPADVFTPEIVVVPARGVERWLTQRLSHVLGADAGSDGVCAGLQVMTPASLVGMLLGRDRDDPWAPDRLTWPVLDAIDAAMGSPGFETLTRHLGGTPPSPDPEEEWTRKARQSRRYAVARRLAGLFGSYIRQRPAMLAAWERGENTDGFDPIASDLAWQPVLWREVVASVLQRGGAEESPSARHERVLRGLRDGSLNLDLPQRVSLFGHTRLASPDLDLLEALASHREVHLWLPHPSPALWQDLSRLHGVIERTDDISAEEARHPLLAALGRDTRELERMVLSHDVVDDSAPAMPRPTGSRLHRLQEDIAANRPPSAEPAVPDDDLSLQIHACHGRARQVEVLREVLVWLLDEGAGALQPRDIIVMCPDVEIFAPLIQATFATNTHSAEESPRRHPGQDIRVQLADRALGATNPLVDVAQRLLTLVTGRLTAPEVLDFAALPVVARRFGFDEDNLDKLARWIADGSVRWGLDGAHRQEYGLAGLMINTWESGLDRLALGAAVAEHSSAPIRSALPLDDVGSNDLETAGRLIELVERLRAARQGVRQPSAERPDAAAGTHTVTEWVNWLRRSVLGLAEVGREDRWQIAQFEHELSRMSESATSSSTLRLTDVRVMIEQRWAGRPTRSNFRTGAVTVCTMVPMRSVPHKAVIVLGADDGVYPRQQVVDGDDVLARRPATGERDVRSEDNQLLLDAVMAAQEYFVTIYSGFDERNGEPRPPAVPVQQLVAAAARTGGAPPASPDDAPPFVRKHPLQAFDERNFVPAQAAVPHGSYDSAALEGARALRSFRGHPHDRRAFLEQPLPERAAGGEQPTRTSVTIDELVAFYENPAREFLRRRLEITVPREDEELDTAIPLAPDPLAQWAIGDRMLKRVLEGTPLPEAIDAERINGALPPGDLADQIIRTVSDEVSAIADEHAATDPVSHDIHLDLPGGTRLLGVVGGVSGETLETLQYSRVAPKHVVGAWVRLLALSAAGTGVTSAALRGKGSTCRLTAPSPAEALNHLDQLAEYRNKGMTFPIGIPPKTASEYTRRLTFRRGKDLSREAVEQMALDDASSRWVGKGTVPGENADPWWSRILGPNSTIADLNGHRTLQYWGPLVWEPIHDHGGLV